MSRYYFHLSDAAGELRDPDGTELEDLVAAVAHALVEARALLSFEAIDGTLNLNQHFMVEDEARTVVHRLDFRDAVTVTGQKAA